MLPALLLLSPLSPLHFHFPPLILLLLLLLLLPTLPHTLLHATPVHAHCSVLFGPISLPAARAAASLIPRPTLSPERTAQNRGDDQSIAIDLPAAARQIRYPILFHAADAVVELYQARLEGAQTRLLRTEQAFYLWPRAREVAEHVIRECVQGSSGERGGWTRFPVQVPGGESRSFVLTVKRRGVHGVTFQVMRNWGYQVWPEAEG